MSETISGIRFVLVMVVALVSLSLAEASDGGLPELPTAQQLQVEKRADPSAVPPSLVQFAVRLAPFMEKALVNEGAANQMMDWLSRCTKANGALQARMVCGFNAERLMERYPLLASRGQAALADFRP